MTTQTQKATHTMENNQEAIINCTIKMKSATSHVNHSYGLSDEDIERVINTLLTNHFQERFETKILHKTQ